MKTKKAMLYALRDLLFTDGGALPVGRHTDDGFQVTFRWHGLEFTVRASWGMAWDHVSISTPHRTPSWREMDLICRCLWAPAEVVMQLHMPPADNVNIHPYCLHLWRPQNSVIPLPPVACV